MRRFLTASLAGLAALASPGWAAAVSTAEPAPLRPAGASAPLPELASGERHGDRWVEPLGLDIAALRNAGSDGLLVGAEDPKQLTIGMQLTQGVLDVDGDGVDELLQVRGNLNKPKVVLADGATGLPIWTNARPNADFLLSAVPSAGGGQDLLMFTPGLMVSLIDGRTGVVRWTKGPIAGSEGVGYFGVVAAGDGYEIVMGAWEVPLAQMIDLNLQFMSLSNGAITGTRTLTGEAIHPSVTPAGDLDGDGIGDLFALEAHHGFGAGVGGTLTALTDRGATEHWQTTFLQPVSDFAYVIGSMDATGDGTNDAVILSQFIGAFGVIQENDLISIVDGDGGDTAGIDPITTVDLDLWVHGVSFPGDVNGDGREDAIFSGAVIVNGNEGAIAFEAVSQSGSLWYARPGIPLQEGTFGYQWHTDAGDLSGDGTGDALVLLATGTTVSSIGLSQRDGAQLWRADSAAGAFDVPAYTDLDGDGADDVVHAITGTRPTPSTIRVTFSGASGRDLRPLWTRDVTLDLGSSLFFNVIGGHLDGSTTRNDLITEYTLAPSYSRHYAECLDGFAGGVLWTS